MDVIRCAILILMILSYYGVKNGLVDGVDPSQSYSGMMVIMAYVGLLFQERR